ncbi:hypothetical protein FACS1894188_12020 [Clostridia bacterium]|nr:hypothetical protein FACS1894188_12020 [Clostridia bacterium]
MADGDAALYTIPDSDAEKFFYGYNEIIDKTMPAVDWATLTYIDINAFGTEIEAEQKDKYYVMTKPYQGREFYPALLAQTANFDGYELGDLVEIGAEDLAKYGLDAPKIKISLKDGGGTFDISVGNGENPDFSYALFEGNVFLVENSMFAGFDEIVPLKLISRFVNLLNIDDVDKINVTISQFFKYEILINHGDDGTIAPTINGEPVEETAARDCYQAIIALSADAVVDFDKADSKPAFSVVFTKTDGTVVSSDYYDYDENFFAVELDGTQGKYFAVNKDSVKKILDLIPF